MTLPLSSVAKKVTALIVESFKNVLQEIEGVLYLLK
jgi:hypothetical protein